MFWVQVSTFNVHYFLFFDIDESSMHMYAILDLGIHLTNFYAGKYDYVVAILRQNLAHLAWNLPRCCLILVRLFKHLHVCPASIFPQLRTPNEPRMRRRKEDLNRMREGVHFCFTRVNLGLRVMLALDTLARASTPSPASCVIRDLSPSSCLLLHLPFPPFQLTVSNPTRMKRFYYCIIHGTWWHGPLMLKWPNRIQGSIEFQPHHSSACLD